MTALAIVLYAVAVVVVLAAFPVILRQNRVERGDDRKGPTLRLAKTDTWYARWLPLVVGVAAGLVVYATVSDIEFWGVALNPIVASTATSWGSYAFVGGRVSPPIQAVLHSVITASFTVIALLAV